MRNPFLGEGSNDDEKPLELTDEFETRVYPSAVKKPEKRKGPRLPKSNLVLVVRGAPNNVLVRREIPSGMTMTDFVKGWTTHREKERIEKVVEKTTDVIEVPKTIRQDYVRDLNEQIDAFTKFIVSDLSPVANGFETALDQSEQMLRLITKSDQDMSQTGTIRAMLRDAMQMKALHFISEKLGLSKEQMAVLVEKYFKPKDVHVHPTVQSTPLPKPEQKK